MKRIVLLVIAVILLTGCDKFDWKEYISSFDKEPIVLDHKTFKRIATEIEENPLRAPDLAKGLDIDNVKYYVFQDSIEDIESRSFHIEFPYVYDGLESTYYLKLEGPKSFDKTNVKRYMESVKFLTDFKEIDGIKYYYGHLNKGLEDEGILENKRIAFYKDNMLIIIDEFYFQTDEFNFELALQIYKLF